MKKLQELTLFDKFLFDETMDIPEAHEAVLQIIFGDDNLKLLTPRRRRKKFAQRHGCVLYVWMSMPWIRKNGFTIQKRRRQRRKIW